MEKDRKSLTAVSIDLKRAGELDAIAARYGLTSRVDALGKALDAYWDSVDVDPHSILPAAKRVKKAAPESKEESKSDPFGD